MNIYLTKLFHIRIFSTITDCDTVETTSLDSLPGHKTSAKQIDTENNANILNDESLTRIDSTTNTLKNSRYDPPAAVNTHSGEKSLFYIFVTVYIMTNINFHVLLQIRIQWFPVQTL